jgi:hypothetical protein
MPSLALAALLVTVPLVPAGFDHTHRLLDEVLKESVRGDRVDYRGVDRAKLSKYLEQLGGVTPEALGSWTRKQRFAFWINAYNAHVIDLVLEHYPVESIEDVGSLLSPVWKKEFIRMNVLHPDGDEDRLSLDDVEHKILRPRFEDARVHAAINCASISCPPLRAEAFVAERLDEQLDAQMRAFVVDESRNRYDKANGVLYLSKIFDWFEEDFARDAGSVKQYLFRYAPKPLHPFIQGAEIGYLDYDWSLNDVEADGE